MKPIDRIVETAIYADDLGGAERFYREILGLALLAYFRDPSGNLVELLTPGVWGLPSGW
jgi:catechol 2,3-dioxygenase-like lactoylglutathione lyase family enzyme